MGTLNKFDILLDQPQAVYGAGNYVRGQCVVDLKEPMKMRGIHLKIKGAAIVHWEEEHTIIIAGAGPGASNTYLHQTIHYENHENYMDFTFDLFGNPEDLEGDSVMHPAGKHIYPFQIQLPQNLPSSFQGEHGGVLYCATATIDKPRRFNHTTRRLFTVLSDLDLNLQPTARSPSQGQDSMTLCCWCCSSGPISAVLRIDRSGFVPGEFITISGEVDNKSNRRIDSTSVLLIMYTTFIAKTDVRTTEKTIAEIRKGPIEEGDSEIWSGEQLTIPPLPPSFLLHCNIINVRYVLKMKVDRSCPGSFHLDIPLDITIGTIPLANLMDVYPSAPSFDPTVEPAMDQENTGPALPNTPLPMFS